MGDLENLTHGPSFSIDPSVTSGPVLCPNYYNEEEAFCSDIDDSFIPVSMICDYETLLNGFPSSNFQACFFYTQWLLLITSPYLANPSTRNTIDNLLNQAYRLGVPQEDLIQVYRAALPEYSVEDRLARVRTYLMFEEAQGLNARMPFSDNQKVKWKVPSISPDFDHFAQTVMEALKKGGAVNVREVEELRDELGFPLSGLYQELDHRTVRIRFSEASDFSNDWLCYVTFHEFRHWYNTRQKKKRPYEAEELEAAYLAMKALVVMKGGSEIQWESPRPGNVIGGEKDKPENKLEKIGLAIKTLPKNLRIPVGVVWERIQKFASEQRTTSIIPKVFKAAYFELTEGHPHGDLMTQVHRSLECRKMSTELVLEMDRLIKQMKQEGEPLTCEREETSNASRVQECKMGLDTIVSLAVQNQIPLALDELNKMIATYKQGMGQEESIFSTP